MSVRHPHVRPSAALAALLALSATATAESTVEDDTRVEEIVVTGTWIPGTPEDDALPVNRIDREDLVAEGSPGIVELVRNLSFSQGADGESDQYGSRTGADRATVNLRGLGPSRTLVMLNSHRLAWSPGSVPDQAQLVVDVNLLPMAALSRIEALRDGATATYGSDAVAGVVNVITRADFEGVEVEARHKFVDGSDGDQWLGLIAGHGFGDGAGSVVTSLGLARRAPLPLIEREWAVRSYAENRRGGWSGTGTPAIFVPLAAFAQTAGDAVGMRGVAVVDPNCERLGGAHTNAPAGRPAGGVCRFQYTPFVNLVQDTRRWQWFSEASWHFGTGARLSAELLLAETTVPSWKTSPSYPPSEVIDPARRILANHPALVHMASKYPALYGDYASCDADYCRWQGDGAEQDAAGVPPAWQHVAWINGRHFGQGGPIRGHPRRSTTEHAVVKAEGALGTASWDAALTYARSRRLEEDGAGLHYRSLRSLLGLGGFECESRVPNRFDEAGNLEANLSLRYERYPNQGLSSLDPKLGVRWQVAPGLAVRASAGTAFRAPTINQIEPGIATTSRQFVTRIATFKPILALGNPDLEPEAAATFNVGVIVDRDGLFLSVDYWRYAFERPLVLEPYVRVLDDACPPTLPLCDAGSPYFVRIDFWRPNGGLRHLRDLGQRGQRPGRRHRRHRLQGRVRPGRVGRRGCRHQDPVLGNLGLAFRSGLRRDRPTQLRHLAGAHGGGLEGQGVARRPHRRRGLALDGPARRGLSARQRRGARNRGPDHV